MSEIEAVARAQTRLEAGSEVTEVTFPTALAAAAAAARRADRPD